MDADADVRTVITRSTSITWPSVLPPNTSVPSAAKMSSALSALPSPTPVSPTPANATMAIETMAYVASSSSVDRIAARPGVVAGSLVSSFTATALSQPQ